MCFIHSSRAVSFILVNSVTAADIFQALELSVCVIVDFIQNGDRHSLSQCEKMSPFRGHLQAGILFQYYAHVQYLAAEPPTTREGYCSQNNGTRERRQVKKKKKVFPTYRPYFFFKGHLKHRYFFFWPYKTVFFFLPTNPNN